MPIKVYQVIAKRHIAELTLPHAQSAWGLSEKGFDLQG